MNLYNIASENGTVFSKFKYDIPFHKGYPYGRCSSNHRFAMQSFRFNKEGSRSQLTLKIRNFVGSTKQNLWIDTILNQTLQMPQKPVLSLQFYGLTLNWVYGNLYDEWDEIAEAKAIEKIQ